MQVRSERGTTKAATEPTTRASYTGAVNGSLQTVLGEISTSKQHNHCSGE